METRPSLRLTLGQRSDTKIVCRKRAYLSTILNQAGPSRFWLHCPAVPQSTPPVRILSSQCWFFSHREAAFAHETIRYACIFLLPCFHGQWRFTISIMAMQAGKCVIRLHAMNGRIAHTWKECSAWPPPCMCTCICPEIWSKIPEFKQMWSFVFLICWEVWERAWEWGYYLTQPVHMSYTYSTQVSVYVSVCVANGVSRGCLGCLSTPLFFVAIGP